MSGYHTGYIVGTPPLLIGGDETFQKLKGWGGPEFFVEIGGMNRLGGKV